MDDHLYIVSLKALEIYAYHGVSDEEQVVGHRYSFDLEASVHGTATETDRIEDTVSYVALARIVQGVATGEPQRTLERLASIIADRVLELDPRILSVEVRAKKLLPPMPFVIAEAAVNLRKGREHGS